MVEYCIHSGLQLKYESIADNTHIAKYTINDSGRKQGVYYEYNKQTREMRTMMEFSNGLSHGEMSFWREDGSIHLQGKWVNGKRHGEFIEFEGDSSLGYSIVIYYHDKLIEYYKYNSCQEMVDYEYYGLDSMNRLAAEIDTALFEGIPVPS